MHCNWNKNIKFFRGVIIRRQSLQPRCHSLSSLPPLVVGRKTLVAAGHVTTYDTISFTGVESRNNFVGLNWSERKALVIAMLNHTRANTHLKFSSLILSFTQVKRNIFTYIQRLEGSLWFQFQPVELLRRKTVSLFLAARINLTAHCSLYESGVLFTILQNIILD